MRAMITERLQTRSAEYARLYGREGMGPVVSWCGRPLNQLSDHELVRAVEYTEQRIAEKLKFDAEMAEFWRWRRREPFVWQWIALAAVVAIGFSLVFG